MNSLTLLPLQPSELSAGIQRASGTLTTREGLTEHEARLQLEADYNDWLDHEGELQPLPPSTQEILSPASWYDALEAPRERTIEKLYASIIKKLTAKRTIGRREAAVTASYLPLISHLASKFNFSSAGIAKVIDESDKRISLHWKAIEKIINTLGFKSEITINQVDALIEEDRASSCRELNDADIETLVEILSYEATMLDLDEEFQSAITDLLAPNVEKPFIPYLQTLFYVCTITAFFDHPPEFLYTFKPRGGVANKIFLHSRTN